LNGTYCGERPRDQEQEVSPFSKTESCQKVNTLQSMESKVETITGFSAGIKGGTSKWGKKDPHGRRNNFPSNPGKQKQ